MQKREFTSVDVSVVVRELKETIVNSRVNKVYQLDPKTLVFKLHKTDEPPMRLVMEAGRRLHLTTYALENPHAPPSFCMALRKYLSGAWITDVAQHEFERIVIFQFRTKSGTLGLVLELFGDGNIILTGEKAEILQALVFKQMRDRNIMRNEVFQFPPSISVNPFKVTKAALQEALRNSGDTEVVRAAARFLGVGGFYAEEILLKAIVDKKRRCSELKDSDFTSIFDQLQSLLSSVTAPVLEPVIVLAEDGTFLDVAPFRLKRFEAYKIQHFSSYNLALDEFYARATTIEKAVDSPQIDKLTREAERLKRVIAEQEQALHEGENEAERNKQIGNVIYANSVEIENLLEKSVTAKREGRELFPILSEVTAAEDSTNKAKIHIESFDARNQALNISLEGLHFSLSLRKTLFENAAEYYDRSKKAKQKSVGARSALDESRKKLSEIEQKLSEAETAKLAKPKEEMKRMAQLKMKNKEWFEKFRWFKSSDDFLVVAGKDSVSNEVLIKKHATQEDVVFHAEITGAPFVVVKSDGKEISEQTLREAGEFAAAYSRAWREGTGSADVYWVKQDQLSKSGPSGEYVPHGAFAVHGKRNWTRSVPLRLAIGVILNGETIFVGGPVEAVKNRTNVYVTIVPGDITGKELLKRILGVAASKLPKEQREKVGKASIESIRDMVPYTKATLTDSSPQSHRSVIEPR
jgi:predicted ribosome quality control (RQC) complex YloA/Tae2 family protein